MFVKRAIIINCFVFSVCWWKWKNFNCTTAPSSVIIFKLEHWSYILNFASDKMYISKTFMSVVIEVVVVVSSTECYQLIQFAQCW